MMLKKYILRRRDSHPEEAVLSLRGSGRRPSQSRMVKVRLDPYVGSSLGAPYFVGRPLDDGVGQIFMKYLILFLLAFFVSACTDNGCVSFNGASLNNASKMVPVSSSEAVNTGITAASGKLIRINVATAGLYAQPQKYRAIVKFDPRFPQPMVFLATYDNLTSKYKVNWAQINGDIRSNINALKEHASLPGIPIKNGDAVNFRVISSKEFYDGNIDIGADLDGNYSDVSSVVTSSGGLDNMLVCTSDVNSLYSYKGNPDVFSLFVGKNPFSGLNNVANCDFGASAPTSSVCKFDSGHGLEIRLNDSIIKDSGNQFIPINSTSGYSGVYYLLADQDGNLKFTTPFDNSGLFSKNGEAYPYQHFSDIDDEILANVEFENSTMLINYLSSYQLNKFFAGRYMLQIDVGSSTGEILQQKIQNIVMKYYIKKGSTIVSSGNIVNGYLETNAPADGQLYVGIENPNHYNDIAGNVVFTASTFTGSNVLSSFLQTYLVKPIKDQLLWLAAILFGSLSASGSFTVMLNFALTLYILLYGITFTLGGVNVTIYDLTGRVVKVMVVSMLFSNTAWSFFNQYLFSMFLETTDKLILAVTNATSTSGNIFGFIDPIIDKYTSPNLWFIIWNYVGFFGYGYILPAIFIIAGILYFFKAILEVFIGYLTAYIALCVMIALGPLFITAMLFEKTRSMFDNWLGIMFGYVIQPTLAMIFILFIDQLSSDMLVSGLRQVCWQELWPVGFYYSNPDIDVTFFTISGYGPENLSSTPVAQVLRVSALFLLMMRLAKEVVNLSKTMADKLTSGGSYQGAVHGGGAADMASGLASYASAPYAIAKSQIKGAIHNRAFRAYKDMREKSALRGEEAISRAEGANQFTDNVASGTNQFGNMQKSPSSSAFDDKTSSINQATNSTKLAADDKSVKATASDIIETKPTSIAEGGAQEAAGSAASSSHNSTTSSESSVTGRAGNVGAGGLAASAVEEVVSSGVTILDAAMTSGGASSPGSASVDSAVPPPIEVSTTDAASSSGSESSSLSAAPEIEVAKSDKKVASSADSKAGNPAEKGSNQLKKKKSSTTKRKGIKLIDRE